MRDYAKLSPKFWTGKTGKALRKRGANAIVVALYLVSAPASNMLGLYYQPIVSMAHETGLGLEGASKGLADCIACGFCSYDEATEVVFVHEMAAWQIAESLSPGDKRCKGIQNDYDALPDNPFLEAWFSRYEVVFHLTACRYGSTESATLEHAPSHAPSKAHRSQEQEQEQEQEILTAARSALFPEESDPSKAERVAKRPSRFEEFWSAWPKSDRKQDKKTCGQKWASKRLDDEADLILAHVAAAKGTKPWREGYEPAPLTYLNRERWRDGAQDDSASMAVDERFAGAL